jgi:hypothetical protein
MIRTYLAYAACSWPCTIRSSVESLLETLVAQGMGRPSALALGFSPYGPGSRGARTLDSRIAANEPDDAIGHRRRSVDTGTLAPDERVTDILRSIIGSR